MSPETPQVESAVAQDGTSTRARGNRESRLLVALLAGKTVAEAATDAGCSKRTAYRIVADETFQTAYRGAKAELLTAATAALHTHSLSFIETLAEVAKDTKLPGSYRVAASREGLTAMFKAVEILDLAERITALERVAKGAGQ
jgi:AraC-like DNA-binding protein